MNSRRMRLMENVSWMRKMRNAYKILSRKREEKKPLRSSWRRWKNDF
jgi:hypothetical protein